jgi:hypothetical protein
MGKKRMSDGIKGCIQMKKGLIRAQREKMGKIKVEYCYCKIYLPRDDIKAPAMT